MNLLALVLFCVCAAGILLLPRKWAAIPLIVGCCYMTAGEGIDIGSFRLPVFRLLLLVGIIRVVMRGEKLAGGLSTIDKLMLAWGAWTLFASLFQAQVPGSGLKYNAGIVFNVAGIYFMIRSLCRDTREVAEMLGMVGIILLPVALAMVYEQVANRNLFSVFGGVPEVPDFRNGRIRAQGPFNHAILAGTIGATSLPFALALWHRYRIRALIGAAAGGLMILTCASSGPILSALFAFFAVGMWRFRRHCRKLRWAAVAMYLLLMAVMNRPPYFLVAEIDLTGASTGWHRAFLIKQTIAHWSEWVFVGTNHTRHWMPNQGAISDNHTDVTNYYIAFGVVGGLLCMLLVIAMLAVAFKWVGRSVDRLTAADRRPEAFAIWCIGASLFSHAMSSFSVAYFGQAQLFFWIPVAVIASLHTDVLRSKPKEPKPPKQQPPTHPRSLDELFAVRPIEPSFPGVHTPR